MGEQKEPSAEPDPIFRDTVSLAEVVHWSYRLESEHCLDNPEFADFAKRYETSEFRWLMEASIHPSAKSVL